MLFTIDSISVNCPGVARTRRVLLEALTRIAGAAWPSSSSAKSSSSVVASSRASAFLISSTRIDRPP